MAAPAATTATPPFASRQRGGEGLFALKSLASARPPGPGQQRSLRELKPVLSAGKSKILAVGGDARGQWFVRRRERAAVSGLASAGLAPRLARSAALRARPEDGRCPGIVPGPRVQFTALFCFGKCGCLAHLPRRSFGPRSQWPGSSVTGRRTTRSLPTDDGCS